MNRSKFLSVTLLLASFGFSQEIDLAKKAIDAEQYQKAKTILKNVIVSKPDQGKAFFLLGNLYLTQKVADSATLSFNKGLSAKTDANFNHIGLGQLELEKGNPTGAQASFDKATASIKKKDFETLLYVARAYMNKIKPDYKKALTYVNKAVAIQPQDAQVQLALGDASYGDKNVNAAYPAYRDAFDADNNLLRAKLQLAVITKRTKAFAQAKTMIDDILKINPSYGPAYRELAETYYLWALSEGKNYDNYNKLAIQNYEKYMTLTDYSLDSRMRHADFMILTKDYKGLEAEANAMQKLDKVNPRILRYLGYSAFKNGNSDIAIKALTEFLEKEKTYTIAPDYSYLGLSKLTKAITMNTVAEKTTVSKIDQPLFDNALLDLKKAVEMDNTSTSEISEYAKKLYSAKAYKQAATLYELVAPLTASGNYFYDNYFLGSSYYYDNNNKPEGQKVNAVDLKKALLAFDNVIKDTPTTQDAFIFKARIYGLLGTDAINVGEMVKNYQQYADVLNAKDQAEKDKPNSKTKLAEAYNNLGVFYIKTDKVKAKDFFTKVLAIDPTNTDATNNIKFVK